MKYLSSRVFRIAILIGFAFFLGTFCRPPFLASPAADSDSQFVAKASAGGMAEVKMGKLAQEKGSSEAVKSFGERMVTDHSKAAATLKTVAERENIPLPSEISSEDQATYEHLSKLSGKDFDQAYASAMVKDHETDISEFKQEATTGTNAAVKQFAANTLPTLESHLKQAKQMAKTVNAPMM